ncbi:MAG TPA: outer membrane beta-barrel protein [Pirellulales bacterium]|nr:outer membrane beta-barrel protein [Pirellulales bacterium]
MRQPASLQQSSFSEYKYNSYYEQDASAAPPAAEEQAPAAAAAPAETGNACNTCSTNCNCNACCDDGCLAEDLLTLGGRICPDCKPGDPHLLLDHFPCLKKCTKVKMGGWLDQSYTWNPQNPSNGFNGPVTWTDRSNSYELNQLYYWIERTCDNGGDGWAWGARADLLFGTDYRFNTESNLETRYQFQSPKNMGNDRFYGFDYLQFFGEVAYDKSKFRVGHFLSPVGYEVIPTTGNFFPTLPYIFQYGEPFTHTGGTWTYTVDETLTVSTGIIRGWDNFGNNNPHLGNLTTLTKTFEDKSSYATVFIWSSEPNQNNGEFAGGSGNRAHTPRFIWTHAYTKPLTEKLTYVGQFDYAQQTDAMVNGRLARWYGWNQYLFYKVSDCWTWGTRFDIWRDEEGFRMGGFLGSTNNGAALRGLSSSFNSFAGTNYELSVGANWRPNGNTVIRPAVRWDMFQGNSGWGAGQQAFNGGAPTVLRPYDNGAHDWQILIGFDWITLF